MGESALTEFIVEFAPAAVTRGHIARYVRTTTDLAHAGDRMTPAILQRMLRRVRDIGHAVVIPVCERCGRERIIGRGPDERRVCKPCTDALRAEICVDCGRLRPVCIRRDGKPLCNNCRRRLPEAKKPCIRCGNARLVYTDPGRPALPGMRTREGRTLRALRPHRPGQSPLHRRRDLQPLLRHHPRHPSPLPAMPARHPRRIRRRRRNPRLHTLRRKSVAIHLRQLRHRRHPRRQKMLPLQCTRRRRRPLR